MEKKPYDYYGSYGKFFTCQVKIPNFMFNKNSLCSSFENVHFQNILYIGT